jgi:DNA-binding beta-propeller fold protein YncE
VRTRMTLVTSALAAALIAGLAGGSALLAADGPYSKVGEIQIGGAASFDYLNVDSANHRLYVSHGTEVVVIDTATNTIVGRIGDTPGVHGIVFAPELGRGFTSNGREGKAGVFDLKTLAPIAKIDTGGNPDAILYEPTQKRVYTFNGSGAAAVPPGQSATVIDAANGSVVATIPLGDKPETGQADAALGRVFVNLENKSLVGVIDMKTNQKIAEWPIAPTKGPTGMAIDAEAHRLFVGGDGFTVMIDAQSGKVVASAPICGGTDATWFDPGTKYVFSSCGDGHITVMHEDSPTALSVVQTIDTERGARTMAVDTATHRLYTVAGKYGPPDPNAAAGRGRGAAIPDSFHVLVLGLGGK